MMRLLLMAGILFGGGSLLRQAEDAHLAGKPKEAARYWNALRREVPTQATAARYNRILALIDADSASVALRELELLLPQLTDSLWQSRALNLQGLLLASIGQPEQLRAAVAPLMQSLRLDPQNAHARRNLEIVLRRLPPPPPNPPPPPPPFLIDRPSPYVPPPTEGMGSIRDYPKLDQAGIARELKALASREKQYLQQLRRFRTGRKQDGPNW
jgi:hypothetical protein